MFWVFEVWCHCATLKKQKNETHPGDSLLMVINLNQQLPWRVPAFFLGLVTLPK